jgi:glutathione S-transferase
MIDNNMYSYELFIANKKYSSWSMRPWLVLEYFSIKFTEHLIKLKNTDTHDKIKQLSDSVSQKVPFLKINIDDKTYMLADSLAICEFLAETHTDKNLWPKDSMQRAKARMICAQMHSGFMPLRHMYNMNVARAPKNDDAIKLMPSNDVKSDIAEIERIWTTCRKSMVHDGKYLFGEFSIADAYFAPVVTRFLSYGGIELNDTCMQYMHNIYNTPAVQKWVNDGKLELDIIDAYEK